MTPIIQLQAKVVRFNKRRLGNPQNFLERISPLYQEVSELDRQPKIMVREPNTDRLARIFNAVLDLADHMGVSGEDLIRLAGQRLEIDILQHKSEEMTTK